MAEHVKLDSAKTDRQESPTILSIQLPKICIHRLYKDVVFICRLQKYEITKAFDQIGKADIIDRLNTCLKD